MKSPECPVWAKSQVPKKPKSFTSSVINVGVVAFGLSGRVFHAPFLMTNPHFNLVAVYERFKNEAMEFATSHGSTVDTVRSLEDLLFRTDIQLIVICSPIEFHHSQARQALAAGKHVLVEKAFCSTSEEALDLLTFAREKGLVCMPYQNRRYDSDFLTLQRLLAEGCMGEIVEYNGFFNRYSPYVRKGAWKDTAAGSGGNFLSLGSHMIDQAVILFGPPSRVWADLRCQREGGVLDDAWEVHLFYDARPPVVEEGGEESDEPNPDSQGLHRGGFRAILKGSLLCVDHAVRYMVHGKNGSWIKRGMDTQEAYLMRGKLPFYRLRAASYDVDDDEYEDEESHSYGIEDTSQWGHLSIAGQKTVSTPAELGSYHLLYDELYHRITTRSDRSTNSIDMVPVVVLRIIELSKLSSLRGQVMPMDTTGL
jgi:scyllo-inositol 2-dehydrogenase (NADP+)